MKKQYFTQLFFVRLFFSSFLAFVCLLPIEEYAVKMATINIREKFPNANRRSPFYAMPFPVPSLHRPKEILMGRFRHLHRSVCRDARLWPANVKVTGNDWIRLESLDTGDRNFLRKNFFLLIFCHCLTILKFDSVIHRHILLILCRRLQMAPKFNEKQRLK